MVHVVGFSESAIGSFDVVVKVQVEKRGMQEVIVSKPW